MSLAECQNNQIDVNFHLQKSFEIFDKKSVDKFWSKKDRGWKVPSLVPIRVKDTVRSWKISICITTFSGKFIWMCPRYSFIHLFLSYVQCPVLLLVQTNLRMTKIFRFGSKNLWLKQNWLSKTKIRFFDEGPKSFWDQSKMNLEK